MFRTAFSNRFIRFVPLLLVVTDAALLLNIPVLRQFLAFAFLTFVPGAFILIALRLDKLGWTEKITLAVGVSISFVMLFGLVLNYTLPVFGYMTPLSLPSLLISFNIAILLLAIAAYLRNKNFSISLPVLVLTVTEKALLIVPSLFPLLSIAGMRLMNATDNNILLMILLLLIPAYVVFISIFQKRVSERLYPAFAFLIGISVLLLTSFRSNHIIGSDVHESYYFFLTTMDSQYWSVTTPSLIQSLLSISLLPAIYQGFLNAPQELFYKVLFSLLFSISPLVVFIIAKKYIGGFYAFLTSFFFMSQVIFLWTAGAAQTSMAILFFTLAIMVHFHEGIDGFSGRLFLLIFVVSSVVSHYSTSYIFFLILLLTLVGTRLLHWFHKRKGLANIAVKADSQSPQFLIMTQPVAISMTVVLIFFVVIFLWHSQITRYAFDFAVSMIYGTLLSMNQSLLLESKGSSVIGALGHTELPTIPQQIRFVFSWLGVIFIFFGGVNIFARYKKSVAYPGSGRDKLAYLNSKFEMEFFVLSAVCGLTLAAAVILPYISVYYSMERLYFQSLVVLAPYFTICGHMIGERLRIRSYLLILPVLIPFFMAISGTMYNLFGIPASLLLNSEGTEYRHIYVHDRESYAAKWLGRHSVGSVINTDRGLGPRILASQGNLSTLHTNGNLFDDYKNGKNIEGYLFLFFPEVVKGEAALSKYARMNIIAAPDLLNERDKVYSVGLTEIYRSR